MGFGKLLIGYTCALLFPLGMGQYGFAAMLIGSFVMYLGLTELRKYCPTFIYALVADIVMILLSVYLSVAGFDSIFDLGWGLSGFVGNSWIKLAVTLAFDASLLIGVADMCRRVELDKMYKNAFTNMIPMAVFYIAQTGLSVYTLTSPDIEQRNEVMGTLMTLLSIIALVYIILNIVLIFKCYVYICPEGDEDMPRKPSRLAFMNRLAAKMDEKQERAKRSTDEYYNERFGKIKDKKKKNKKK